MLFTNCKLLKGQHDPIGYRTFCGKICLAIGVQIGQLSKLLCSALYFIVTGVNYVDSSSTKKGLYEGKYNPGLRGHI